jgi:hypothetical protein
VNTFNTSPTRLIPVPDWPNLHPWPSVAGLRHLIFHAERNGFSRVIKRAGRRVLIDEAAFFDWVASGTSDATPTRHRGHVSSRTSPRRSADEPNQRGAR